MFHTREHIEGQAGDLLHKYGMADSFPIDPYALADRMDVVVNVSKFFDDTIAGDIRRTGDEIEINVRRSDPVSRQVFTVAHELGHLVLHHLDGDGECVDTDANLFRHDFAGDAGGDRQDRRREIQANLFAAALLMPEAAVRREWARRRTIRSTASYFGVSEAAMRYRIDQLGIW